jgi:hypothetical protein
MSDNARQKATQMAARSPKNPAVQRRILKYKKEDRPGAVEATFSPPGPDNIVLYFVGRSDGKYVKFGKGRTVADAWDRWRAHTKSVTQNGQHFVFLAACWATEKDETWFKRNWNKKLRVEGSLELVEADADVRDYIGYLRTLSHTAHKSPDDLNRNGVQDFALWRPAPGRTCAPKVDLFALGSKDPWAGILSIQYVPEDDYFTSDVLTELVHSVYGGPPGLDPASCEIANSGGWFKGRYHKGIRALRYFNQFENGLLRDWTSEFGEPVDVYLNPPFNKWEAWGPKIVKEYCAGHAKQIIAFCTFQTATNKVISKVKALSSGVFITNGRIDCWGPNATGRPSDGNAIFYLGDNPRAFYDAFSSRPDLGDAFIRFVKE